MKYTNIIDTFTWSYSRLQAFENCPYGFLLKYIFKADKEDKFFAQYGSFVHKILEKYHNGELDKSQLVSYYLSQFYTSVTSKAPSPKIFTKYFKDGLNYFQNITPSTDTVMGVEQKVSFTIADRDFTGFIDKVSQNDNHLIITDNKSRTLKHRSRRSKPTKSDEELDSYLRQLYLYSIPIHNQYGRYPDKLCFNCFRTQEIITEEFNKESLEKTKQWALETINRISQEDEWNPNLDWFKCKYICDCSNECEYFKLL